MKNELSDLAGRMERLESANRRLKWTGGFLLGGLALSGLAAMAAPSMCDVIYGERLVLRDSSGRQRLVMDAYRNEAPTITWHDKDGRALAKLGLNADGIASLDYFDKQGASKASYQFAPGGVQKAEASKDAAPSVAQANSR